MTFVVVKVPPMSERARRATAEAKRLLPSWSAFARMLARKPGLAVKLTGGTPCTDGETVWLRVPIQLGDEVAHEKSLCSQRDESKRMLCPACAVLDGVNTTIFHEIAHIIHGSFEEVEPEERLRLVDDAIRLEYADDERRAANIRRKIEKEHDSITSWIRAANLVSPYLPMLLNAIEDVWVNAEMMEGRPGTRVMFSAQTTDVFENGVEQEDGRVIKWSEQPLNAQAVIGIYCQGSGLDYSSWLAEKVVEDMDDDEVKRLVHRIRLSRSARARYRLSIQILEALRRLGYLLSEDDSDDEPDPGEGEPSDDESEEEAESSGSSIGDIFGEDDTGDSDDDDADKAEAPDTEKGDDDGLAGRSRSSSDDESDDDGSDDESDDDGDDGSSSDEDSGSDEAFSDGGDDIASEERPMGDPNEVEDLFKIFGRHDKDDEPPTREDKQLEDHVERAINQDEHFDEPSHTMAGLRQYRADDAPGVLHPVFRMGLAVDPTPETVLAPSLAKLRLAFADNHRHSQERNLKKGRRFDRKVMGRRIATDDPRLFSRKNLPGKRDYFVVIGLDISGSTGMDGLVNLIKQAGAAQAELLSRLRIPFALYCHSGNSSEISIFEIKGPNEPWNDKTKQALDQIGSYYANLDGHTLEFYRKRVEEHRATDKLILYYTDGAMPAENYHEELKVLQRNIDLCQKQDIRLVGIGVRTDDPVEHGLDTIRLDDIEDLPKVIDGLRERLM